MKTESASKLQPSFMALLWLLALTLAGGYLRVHGVSDYYYNPDEISNIALAKAHSLGDVLSFSAFETHPPYPNVIRHYLLQLSDAPWFLRGESAVFGVMCIWVYYCIGKNLGGLLTGCIAAFIVAFSYGNILQSQVVRDYTLLALLLGLSYYCYQRFMRLGLARDAVLYVICGLAALMTHYSAIFLLFCIGFIATCCLFKDKKFSLLRLWILANAMLGLYFAYQYMTEIRHNAYEEFFALSQSGDLATAGYAYRILAFAFYLLYGAPFITSYYLGLPPFMPFTLFFCFALLYTIRTHKRFFWEALFALQLGAALIALNLYHYVGGRHVIWELPYIVLPVSLFVSVIGRWLHQRLGNYTPNDRPITLGIMGIALLTGFVLCNGQDIPAAIIEHPLTLSEQQERVDFLKRLTSHDVVIAAELTVPYLLEDSTLYYTALAHATPGQTYFSAPLYNTRLLYMPHTIINGHMWNMHELITMLNASGELKGVQTIWIIQTHYGNMLFREFVKCMQKNGKATLIPPLGTANLDDYDTLMKPKFVGIPRDVLVNHDYTCNDDDE